MAHSTARSAVGFGAARIALGLGEAGNFPAAIKTVAEWFPRKERALATGIFNSGSNIGAIVAPLTVPFIAINYGWQWAFICTGAIGFIWLVFWLALYRRPEDDPKLSRAEAAHINSDAEPPVERIAWSRLLPHRQTWAFAIGKFLTDPIWWVWLFWLPPFLNSKFGLDITKIGPPLIVIYIIADVGSIGGGWLSSSLIKRGWSVNSGRKIAMLICSLCVLPVVFATLTTNLWTSVLLISLAAAAHQGFSANIFTDCIRYVSPTGRWFCCWDRRNDRFDRWDDTSSKRRFYRLLHEFIFFGIRHSGVGLSCRLTHNASSGSEARTRDTRI